VDVDVELARQLEDAVDLPGLVGVVARRAADHPGAALEPLDQERIGAGIADQAFLGKDADLDVDRPAIVGDQRLHALEAAHADAGIDLDLRAHAGGAVLDAFFERARRPCAYVLDGHALLQRGDALHGTELAALLRRTAVDDARLVEVDMGFDQAGTDEMPLGVVDLGVSGEAAGDGDDAPALDADVERPFRQAVRQERVADNKIHHSALMLAAL